MSVAADIGEAKLKIAADIVDKLGNYADDDESYGWCSDHDSNTIYGWCWGCDYDANPAGPSESLEDFVQRAFDWWEAYYSSDDAAACFPAWAKITLGKLKVLREAWGSAAAQPPNRAMRRRQRGWC